MLIHLARQLIFRPCSVGTRRTAWLCVPALGAALACSSAPGGAALGQDNQAFVNGNDDRVEYFELPEGAERAAFEQFSVVLMSAGAADAVASGDAALLRTWGETNNLCPDQPFVDQPSAAFCSGVLLDWNLVLTSGHCVDAVPLESLRVAFGFYYSAADQLALRDEDVYPVAQVLTSRRAASKDDDVERLDFAWLELTRDVSPGRRPAAAYVRGPSAAEGAPVISIGAGGGAPLKWDDGGHVQSTRYEFDDYFVADTDTSQGSSGGGIFDENLVLLGSLARGAADFSLSEAGCNVTATESDPAAAREQFTYVHRAVQALCAEGSASPLCDPACDEPCDVSLFGGPESAEESGCALAFGRAQNGTAPLLAVVTGAILFWRRRSHAARGTRTLRQAPPLSARRSPVKHRAVAAARDG